MNEEKKQINFTGKEYLEYIKYKDKKPKFKLKKETKIGIFLLAGILLFGMIIIMVVDIATPTPPSTFKFTWEGIGMFLAICAGVGWVIHGVGFAIIKG